MVELDVLTVNVEGSIRYETLNDRKYLVAPLSMIVPGVLNGSQGPGLYGLDEIRNTQDAWNNMPIVVNHPTDKDGKGISARNPAILEKTGIGTVFNSTTATGKLASEGWFDIEKTKAVDERILKNLENGNPIELSTGLTLKRIKSKGVHNSKQYTWVAQDFKPDHLAVLPDTKGACSIDDGCGVLVNCEGETKPITNKLSHDDIRVRLSTAVTDELNIGIPKVTDGPSMRKYAWVAEVYDKSFVYEANGKYYSRSYTLDKKSEVITLENDTVEVVRKSEFVPISNQECLNNCDGDTKCKACSKKSTLKIRPITNAAKKKSGKSGANCGIGPNGFSSGNTCAKGSGAAGKGKAKTAKKTSNKPSGQVDLSSKGTGTVKREKPTGGVKKEKSLGIRDNSVKLIESAPKTKPLTKKSTPKKSKGFDNAAWEKAAKESSAAADAKRGIVIKPSSKPVSTFRSRFETRLSQVLQSSGRVNSLKLREIGDISKKKSVKFERKLKKMKIRKIFKDGRGLD